MNYAEFKKKLERIDSILAGAGIAEDKVEIGVDHEKNLYDINNLNMEININENEHNPDETYIVIIAK